MAKKKAKKPAMPKGIEPYETVVPWDPQFKFEQCITFSAKSFRDWLKPILLDHVKFPKAGKATPIGDNMSLRSNVLPLWTYTARGGYFFGEPMMGMHWERVGLDIVSGARKGVIRFDKPIAIPMLTLDEGERFDNRPWTTVMSATPMEILTQRPGIRKAKGKVLIAGFGFGLFARQVAAKKSVKQVTVVELSQSVIDTFAKNLPDNMKVVQGDAFEHAGEHDEYDRYLFDTWNSYGRAEYDKQWIAIKDLRGWENCWAWGDVKTTPKESRW